MSRRQEPRAAIPCAMEEIAVIPHKIEAASVEARLCSAKTQPASHYVVGAQMSAQTRRVPDNFDVETGFFHFEIGGQLKSCNWYLRFHPVSRYVAPI